MPGGDRTGPSGMGPMTGRRAGYCAGNSTPGAANPAFGRGYGGGFGRGLGLGFRGGRRGGRVVPYGRFDIPYAASFATAPSFQQELDALQADAEWLKSSLESITKRIAELEAGKTGD
jgi:hypothetical protein